MAKKRSSVISVLITGDNRELSSALDDSSSKLASFAKGAGVALGAAAVAFTAFAKSGVEAAIEAEAAQARLATILRNTGMASEEQIKALNAQAKALEKVGVASESNITVLQSQLATFDLSADAIQALTPAIADYVVAEKGAAASSSDYQAAANGLAQALQGNFGSLSRVGFVLDDVTKELIANGTESERVAALVDVLGSTYEGFNEKARETAAGGLQALKNQFNSVQQAVGDALLPYLKRLIDWFQQNEGRITEFTDKVLGGLTRAIEFVGGKFGEWRPKVQEAVDYLRERLADVKTFFEENTSGPVDAARERIVTFADTVKTSLKGMVDDIGPTLTGFKEFFAGLDFGDPKDLGRRIGEALAIALEQLLTAITGMSEKFGKAFGDMVSRVDWMGLGIRAATYLLQFGIGLAAGLFSLNWLGPVLKSIGDNFWIVLSAALGLAFAPAKVVGKIAQLLARIPLFGKMASWFVLALNRVGQRFLGWLSDWILAPFLAGFRSIMGKMGPSIGSSMRQMLGAIPAAIRNLWDDMTLALASIFERFGQWVATLGFAQARLAFSLWRTRIVSYIGSLWDDFARVGGDLVRGLIAGIQSMGAALIRAFRNLIDDALKAAKRLLGISSPSKVFAELGREVGVGFALGIKSTEGLVANAASFMGEVGMASAMVSGFEGGGRGVAPVNITVNGALDAEGTARQIRQILQDAERRTGVRL